MNNEESYPIAQKNRRKVCPHLGLIQDPQTSLAYPSSWNVCFHARPVAPPNLEHQRLFCQSGQYRDCPVFVKSSVAPLPPDIRLLEKKPIFRNRVIPPIFLGSIALIFVIIGMIWVVQSGNLPGGAGHPTRSLIKVPWETKISVYTDTPVTLVTETETPTMPPSQTASPTSTRYPSLTPTNTLRPIVIVPTQTNVPTPDNARPPTKTPVPLPTDVLPSAVPPTAVPPTAVPTETNAPP